MYPRRSRCDLGFGNGYQKRTIDSRFSTTGKICGFRVPWTGRFSKAEELQPGLLNGKKITAFSNVEERMALRTRAVPYSLEDRLKKAGADFSTSVIPFTSHTVQDGLFITGQNPAAAGPAAQMLVDALEAV